MSVAAKTVRSRKETRQDASASQAEAEQFRFSGHETFACRFAWLPKACQLIRARPESWSDDEQAMVEMGLGKNMVKSLRFWAFAMGVVSSRSGKEIAITEFGEQVFGAKGLDPYIEHLATHWLLHWNLASNLSIPLFAWHFMFNRWPYPEFSRNEVLKSFERESGRLEQPHSSITLAQHLDIFLHTYLPSKSGASVEDSLDGPLADLGLLEVVGQTRGEGGRREPTYSFRRGRKPEISPAVFRFVVEDYWQKRRPDEGTISLRELCVGDCSPGRILMLSEDDVRLRLEAAQEEGENRSFDYLPSAIDGRIVRAAKNIREPNVRLAYGRS